MDLGPLLKMLNLMLSETLKFDYNSGRLFQHKRFVPTHGREVGLGDL